MSELTLVEKWLEENPELREWFETEMAKLQQEVEEEGKKK